MLPTEAILFLFFGIMIIALLGAVFVVLLALKVYGIVLGIIFGIGTFIPCVGLFVLLSVQLPGDEDPEEEWNLRRALGRENVRDLKPRGGRLRCGTAQQLGRLGFARVK